MPWVISDYTSPTLDLSDPHSFRDLSKPVGALNPKRLAAFRERMEALRGGDIKPFMYGSHYSNAGFVLYYLLRLQPFTRMHLKLQVRCQLWGVIISTNSSFGCFILMIEFHNFRVVTLIALTACSSPFKKHGME